MNRSKYFAFFPAIGLALLATVVLAADLFVPKENENVILMGPWRQSGGAISADVANNLVQSGWSPVRVIGDYALLAAPIAGSKQSSPSWVRIAIRAKGVFGCLPKA
jgi:hypothetical protein